MTDRRSLDPGRSLLLAAACIASVSGWAQSATNVCGVTPGAEYPVGGSCVNRAFNMPDSFTASMNLGTCAAGNYDDAWGWFRATSVFTTVQFQGDQDAILHVFTGSCASLQYVACVDVFGANIAESVTIPTVVNQVYFVRTQRYGSNGAMTGNLCVFSSNPTAACGTTVYDSGGPSGNYGYDERLFYTYCPPVAGQPVTLNFTSFNVEFNYDFLLVYNGSGTGGALLGEFTGTTLPPSLTSTDPSGCITLAFFSDYSGNYAGWSTNVLCSTTSSDCSYVLTLNDSWGDGWNSDVVGYSINGGPFQYWTINGYTGQVVIPLNIGDTFVLDYDGIGPWQYENSFTVSIQGQGQIYASGSPPTQGFHFVHTVDCSAPASPLEDCIGAFTICDDLAFNNNTNNTGFVNDLSYVNWGCIDSGESQGTWYVFSPSTGGNLGFTISPLATTDYDWALWGPYPAGSDLGAICPPPGQPIRCAASSGPATQANTGSYATGMGHPAFSPPQFASTNTTYSIPATTDDCPLYFPQRCGWIPGIQVLEGQVYLLYIDNWDQTGLAFGLSWTLENGASLDCTVLPVSQLDLHATLKHAEVLVDWKATSGKPVVSYVVERSMDGTSFGVVAGVSAEEGQPGAVGSYLWVDRDPVPGWNHYRIQQVQEDGVLVHSQVESVYVGTGVAATVVPNPAGDQAELSLEKPLPPGSRVRVLDSAGRTVNVLQLADQGTRYTLPLQGLTAGVYTVLLEGADGERHAHLRLVKY